MIKKNKWRLLVSSLVILLPIAVGLMMWNALPEEIAAHWSFNGSVDGWNSRAFAVFAMPLIMLAGHWICITVTALDPKNKNQTRKAMDLIFWIFPFCSLFASAMVFANAFGMNMGRGTIFTVALGLMFIVIGNLLPKCKRNYTMGIKVKWALENDENWNATHRFGGKVWVVGGLILMLCGFLPGAVIHYVSFAIIMILAIIPGIYSYRYYRRQKENGTATVDTPLKSHMRIRTIAICIILLACGILLVTGDIRIQYEDTSFTIAATYYRDLTVDYASIEQIEYREHNTPGSRTGGFGSPRLQMGSYLNDEYGYYTRYTYTLCDACVVLTVDGKTLVINGSDAARTRAIYDALAARMDK